MVDPPPWPDRPDNAEDFDLFWIVRGLPPEPFPDESYDYGSDTRFGPPGTRWIFTAESLLNRKSAPGASQGIKAGVDALFQKLRVKLPPAGSLSWTQDHPLAPPALPVRQPMRYARISIVGQLDLDEEVVHTLSLRTAPVVDVDQDAAAMQLLANQVRDIWRTWLYAPIGPRDAPRAYIPGNLTYTEVRAAYVELPGPGRRVLHGQGTPSEHIVYEYDKPTYLVDTQYAPFTELTRGGASTPLPYEVAMVLSLDSGRRGPANRGRLYLGPLGTQMMATNGKFQAQAVQDLASSFATGVVAAINAQTGCDVHIASRYWNDSIPVSSVRAGVVPDSQRRRRRGQNEAYTAPILTPLQPA